MQLLVHKRYVKRAYCDVYSGYNDQDWPLLLGTSDITVNIRETRLFPILLRVDPGELSDIHSIGQLGKLVRHSEYN
jgi:hypothetical protein